jgi:hypothetical protein
VRPAAATATLDEVYVHRMAEGLARAGAHLDEIVGGEQ